MLSVINQPEKDKYCIISNLYVESKKYNKLVNITKKQTHGYGEQTSGYQWGRGQYRGGGGVSTKYWV